LDYTDGVIIMFSTANDTYSFDLAAVLVDEVPKSKKMPVMLVATQSMRGRRERWVVER
jgi:hypothetical protein